MPSKRNKVQKVLDTTSQEVAVLGLVERRELFIVLQRAEIELAEGLNKWLDNAPDGSKRFAAQHYRNALANTRAAMQTMRRLNPYMTGALESARARAARLAFSNVEYELTQFQMLFEGVIRPPNIRVAAVLAKGERMLWRQHNRSAARYAGEVGTHIRRQLSLGVIKNETWDALTGRIVRLMPNQLINEGIDTASAMARGLMQKPRSDAARLVRTESVHAYNVFHNETIIDLARDDDGIRKRWDATLDRRNKTCDICPPLDGQTVKPEEKFELYGETYEHPPAHPNCRCTVIPWQDEWKHDSMRSTGTEGIDAPDPKPLTPRSKERAAAK